MWWCRNGGGKITGFAFGKPARNMPFCDVGFHGYFCCV
jgi:hypothetical protein